MIELSQYRISRQLEFKTPSMLVGWNEDAANLGTSITSYLIKKLDGQEFCEIEPEEYYSLGGVAVENNIAQFPESKFYYCASKDLVIFKSNGPIQEWYQFLNIVLDISVNICHVKEIFTIGGMVTFTSHLSPRALISAANSHQMKNMLSEYDLAKDINYESPPGQRPSLSNYLIWVAKRRNLNGASLWVPIPFYLVAIEDPAASKKAIEFLNKKMSLELDMSDLDMAIEKYNEKIKGILNKFPDLNELIQKLESGVGITGEESNKLVELMQEQLRKEE